MSWKEIGKAINDTILKGRSKPLNRIIEDEAHDAYYKSLLNMEIIHASLVLVIPHGTVEIEESKYANLVEKSVVAFPNTLKSIGRLAFSGSRLSTVVIPPSVTFIGDGAFMDCTNLVNVMLPKSLEAIDDDTFGGTHLMSIVIPRGVKDIGRGAFMNTLLKSVVFEGKPTTIANNAFSGNNLLAHIYVPWSQGEVANAPWGATNATIHYNSEA